MLFEIIVILLLTLLNAFFSCSEIALISVRKTRINSLVKKGSRRAKIIQELQNNPETLFATIQIGISIITITASAFAGSTLGYHLTEKIQNSNIYFFKLYATEIGFLIVVGGVSYINLVIGELVPKSLGLRYSENFSLIAAYPIWWVSKISFLLIKFLSFSSNLILKPFKDTTKFTESRLSEEEIRALLSEGKQAGTIDPEEHNIIQNVFDSSKIRIKDIMVKKEKIIAFETKHPTAQTIRLAIESGFSRVPVYKNDLDNIVGLIHTKKFLNLLEQNIESAELNNFLVPVNYIKETTYIDSALMYMQKNKIHLAIVKNEAEKTQGLVTTEDILKHIVGDISKENLK